MDSTELEFVQNEICDADVDAALREHKIRAALSAEELKKVYISACRHAQARMAANFCVRDAMTRDVLSVNKFDNIDIAVKILAERNVSGLPVVDRENRVVGVISEADVVSMVGSRREHSFKDYVMQLFGYKLAERKMGDIVADIMTSPAVTIRADEEIGEAVRLMDTRRIRRLAVVDKEQRLVGLLSRADIVRAMGKRKEEG